MLLPYLIFFLGGGVGGGGWGVGGGICASAVLTATYIVSYYGNFRGLPKRTRHNFVVCEVMASTPTQIETDVIATQCASFRHNDGHYREYKEAFLLHKLQLEIKLVTL